MICSYFYLDKQKSILKNAQFEKYESHLNRRHTIKWFFVLLSEIQKNPF